LAFIYFAYLLYLGFRKETIIPVEAKEAAEVLEPVKSRYKEGIDKNGFKWDNNLNEWTNTKYVNY
jgi:hypothetical protein